MWRPITVRITYREPCISEERTFHLDDSKIGPSELLSFVRTLISEDMRDNISSMGCTEWKVNAVQDSSTD